MKRMYTCRRAFARAGWEVGKQYELEEKDALESIELGILEPVPIEENELLLQRVLERMEKSRVEDGAALAASISAKVFEQLNITSSGGPVRVKVVENEDDKTKGLGEFLQCVGLLGVQQADHTVKQAAAQTLERVYKARPDPTFKERWAKSQADGGHMTLKAALAEASGITGGYTVPTQYAMELLQLAAEDALLVDKTDEYELVGAELKMPVLDQTTPTGTAGQTSLYGGIICTWTGEAATRQETEPKFKEITLKANELSGYALASRNVLFDNKVALEQRLTRLFAGAIGWYRDYAYLAGDGVAKPRGIMGSPATLTVSRGTPNQVNYVDIAKMLGKLHSESYKYAFWAMQQSVLQSFLQMTDGSGRLIIQPYWPGAQGGPATVRPAMMMFGLPIKVTEKLSTLGTAGDLMLIDPKAYFSATRQDIEIAASEHYKFINNQVTYRFIFRGDGQPWLDLPVTLADQTTQVSPWVKLV